MSDECRYQRDVADRQVAMFASFVGQGRYITRSALAAASRVPSSSLRDYAGGAAMPLHVVLSIAPHLTTAIHLAAQAGNPIGAAARTAIDDAEATGKPGAEKKEDAAVQLAQVVMAEAARGGVTAAEADAKNFAGMVIEEVLTSIKQTPVVSIGLALLKLLGVA